VLHIVIIRKSYVNPHYLIAFFYYLHGILIMHKLMNSKFDFFVYHSMIKKRPSWSAIKIHLPTFNLLLKLYHYPGLCHSFFNQFYRLVLYHPANSFRCKSSKNWTNI